MARMIFVNLPVSDLDHSTAFCRALGAGMDPAATGAAAFAGAA